VLIEMPSTNPSIDPESTDEVELAVTKGRASEISPLNSNQRNEKTGPEEAMKTFGVFIASKDRCNENTPKYGEHSTEHMLLQKEQPSLGSMTFDSESVAKFRTRMSQSKWPRIRHLARIDCSTKTRTVGTVVSHSDQHAVEQPAQGKPAVIPLSQVVFNPGIALTCSRTAGQSRFGFFRYLARTCILPGVTNGPMSPTVSIRDSIMNSGPNLCPNPPPAVELSTASNPVPFPVTMDQNSRSISDPNPSFSQSYPYWSCRTDNVYPIVQDTGPCMWSRNGYPEQTFDGYGGFKGFDAPLVECF